LVFEDGARLKLFKVQTSHLYLPILFVASVDNR
jgi:hypothetical protein